MTKQATPQIIKPYSIQDYDNQLEKLYVHSPENIDDRIAYFSQAFLNAPYVNGALGEGPQGEIDKNPLYRTDAFDCTTYVATVLALAESNNLAEFKKNIIKINYCNDTVSYSNRNHFVEVDWNHKNQKNNFLRDINDDIVDESNQSIYHVANTLIEKSQWYAKKTVSSIKTVDPIPPLELKKILHEWNTLSRSLANEKSEMHYIPLTALFDETRSPKQKIFDQIPTACVIEIVRPNWDLTALLGTHLNISHMGFALREQQNLIFRDASTITHTVRDILLVDYLREYLLHPTIKGIHVQKIISA